ncbi:hypothetical protein BDV96DRAFT_319999 [Lophiotrema nucula]|uniref:Uncharacterized protein n=1 Tax=Lophiotrema nucula TaxID=690887 RepID=A0A6A5ZLX9_9PLEO|nr:hypothetical protein BDV96DRAFT_319999 [Lophiotrema nucula]
MSKRHNRKRTRSRPRHRDGKAHSTTVRTLSVDTNDSFTTTYSTFQPSHFSSATQLANHWHQTYSAWQSRLREGKEREEAYREAQRLRFFGGEAGDEVSLLEPMLKVVTDLFDGDIDYEDP